jgi:hypothetical protein
MPLRDEIARRPWRRGIGSDAHTVFDDQGRIVADKMGYNDGNLIAAAPDLYEYVASSASAGCATARAIIDKLNLEK